MHVGIANPRWENVPGIPRTRDFTYPAGGPLTHMRITQPPSITCMQDSQQYLNLCLIWILQLYKIGIRMLSSGMFTNHWYFHSLNTLEMSSGVISLSCFGENDMNWPYSRKCQRFESNWHLPRQPPRFVIIQCLLQGFRLLPVSSLMRLKTCGRYAHRRLSGAPGYRFDINIICSSCRCYGENIADFSRFFML